MEFMLKCQVRPVSSVHGDFQRLRVTLPDGVIYTTYHEGHERLAWPGLLGQALDRLHHAAGARRFAEGCRVHSS